MKYEFQRKIVTTNLNWLIIKEVKLFHSDGFFYAIKFRGDLKGEWTKPVSNQNKRKSWYKLHGNEN